MKIKYLKKLRRQAELAFEIRDYGVPKECGKCRYVLYESERKKFVSNANDLQYIKTLLRCCKYDYIMWKLRKLRGKYNKPSKHRKYKIIKID